MTHRPASRRLRPDIGSAQTLHDEDVHAANLRDDQERIGIYDNPTAHPDGAVMRLTLPPASWTAVTLEATSRRPERLWQLVHEAGNDLAAFVDE